MGGGRKQEDIVGHLVRGVPVPRGDVYTLLEVFQVGITVFCIHGILEYEPVLEPCFQLGAPALGRIRYPDLALTGFVQLLLGDAGLVDP